MGEKRIRVLLVDDSVAFRSALRAAISLEPGIELVAEAADGRAAIDSSRTPAGCRHDGHQHARHERPCRHPHHPRRHPDMKVIVLSVSDENVYRTLALDAGANAFLSKTASSSTVTSEILRVHQDA